MSQLVRKQSRLTATAKPIAVSVIALGALYMLLQNVSLLTLCAGVSLFLFAMMLLQESFKVLSGGVLDVFLEKVSNRNWKSFLFGFSVSSCVQSSGLATVIAISFLSAGLMTLPAGVAMVYGVNLSTAGSAWIVGYLGLKTSISLYAMPLLIFGIIFYLNKNKKLQGFGLFMLSLGLLFLGISYMKEGFEDFKNTFDISQFQMDGFTGLLLYTLVGFCVTVITQSSHATLTLALTAVSVGQLSYENSIGVAIGANVGSTIMAVIGSLNANVEGKKITVTHVFFNVFAAFMAIVFFKLYLIGVDYLAKLMGIAADDWVLKLALFTTLFNVVGTVLLYPFITPWCGFLNKVLKPKQHNSDEEKPIFLNEESINFADSAIQTLTLESVRLLENSLAIIAQMVSLKPEDIYSSEEVNPLVASRDKPIEANFADLYRKKFKGIYSSIQEFAVRASSVSENSEHAANFMDLRRANLALASALKEANLLQPNVSTLGFSKNGYVRAEYSALRRNLLRLLRNVRSISEASTETEIEEIHQEILSDSSKFDIISSSSLDTLIRNHRISDTMATSIMNDNALAKSIASSLSEVVDLLFKANPEAIDHEIT